MPVPRRISLRLILQIFVFLGYGMDSLHACVWDSDTLLSERFKKPEMAKVILGAPAEPPDPKPLRKRIEELQSHPRRDDPAWWNDLAGAHLRLGEAKEAAALLEPVLARFSGDYGIHANLGTAYHLMGRYADAAHEIGRDLELNPDAHFGLERYHLALLQYLAHDAAWQRRHVYVDEWTWGFNRPGMGRYGQLRGKLAPGDHPYGEYGEFPELEQDAPPAYRFQWDLGSDPHLEQGILYMATLNPEEPACFVVLGLHSLHQQDLNLAAKAFERAIRLGSAQAPELQKEADDLHRHIRQAQLELLPLFVLIGLAVAATGYYLFDLTRRLRYHRQMLAAEWERKLERSGLPPLNPDS